MPKVSAAHLDARRRGILAAAQRCVARRGPAATTMRDICRAANLSPGAVYRYFSGKAEILAALATQRQQQVERFFEPISKRPFDRRHLLPALEQLAASLDGEAAHDGLQLDLHLWSEALGTGPVHDEIVAGNRRIVSALAASVPGKTDDDRKALARTLLALLQGLAVQKALEPDIELGDLLDRVRRSLAVR